MPSMPSFLIRSVCVPKVAVLAIGIVLIAIQLVLTGFADEVDHIGMSLLFWAAIWMLLSDKQNKLNLTSNTLSIGLAAIGILWIVSNAQLPIEKGNHFVRVAPLVTGLSLGLLASGYQGLKQYRQELAILFFLGIPRVLSALFFDISPLTAKFTSLLLWYAGFDVVREGVFVILPTGSVRVYDGCSGIESMAYLLGLSVIFLIMMPVRRFWRATLPLIAVCIGFFVNSIRVALMAYLVANSTKEAFDYWHEGDGSKIFAIAAVCIFGAVCFLISRQSKTPRKSCTQRLEESLYLTEDA
ncbi:cyanoexosortase A [filamentous cyanobacterium LEGE 07170]|nr:cyanoexosortase A [filamentous cyanobacterium LEGE 07170]